MSGRLLNVPIGTIKVDTRARRDMGDIDGLAESIRTVGLLQPIGVTSDYRLVWGQRRLLAFGKVYPGGSIPAIVDPSLSDAFAAAQAEQAENQHRKDFTPSEAVAMGKRIEELTRTAAKARSLANLKSGDSSEISRRGNFPPRETGKTADKLGESVGMSGKTYRKAAKVVETGTPELVKAMDAGDVSIDAAAALAALPADEQRETIATGPKAARAKAKQQRSKKSAKPAAKSKPEPEAAIPAEPTARPLDEVGQAIPDNLLPAFADRETFDHALNLLRQVTADVNRLVGDADKVSPGATYLRRQQVLADLKNLGSGLRYGRPYAVCPYCKGQRHRDGVPCRGCTGQGWVNRQAYDGAPREMKAQKGAT